MNDESEQPEFPCPLCGDPSHAPDEICDPCKIENKARHDAAETAAKFPIVKGKDLGYDV